VKELLSAAIALIGLSSAAHASLMPVLNTVTLIGTDYEFSYSATLTGDTGLAEDDVLVIFDFGGYVDGSISAGIYAGSIDAYVEFTSPLTPPPGYVDDPTIVNLVFKWIDALPFNALGGPFQDVDFAGLTARSISSDTRIDGYAAITTINNGAAVGLPAFDQGPVAVPVPEPSERATGVLMMLAFGVAGATLRTRRGLARI
jgi:hypothetical protein